MFCFDNFGTHIPEWICIKTVTKLSTSSNECHYTTLWNTCVNRFIIITRIHSYGQRRHNKCLCVMRPTDIREMPVSLAICNCVLCPWCTLLTAWAPNHWLHQCSEQYVTCEVCFCLAVNLLCRFSHLFYKIIQTAQMSFLLWTL